MMCIDIFSKYMVVVLLMSKQPADILAGLMECSKKMSGKCRFFILTMKELIIIIKVL